MYSLSKNFVKHGVSPDVTQIASGTTSVVASAGLVQMLVNGTEKIRVQDDQALFLYPTALTDAYLKRGLERINALGSVSGSVSVDLASGHIHTMTLSGATTLSFANPPAGTSYAHGFILDVTGGDQGITWPAGVIWPGGTAPTLTAGRDIISGVIRNDGAEILLSVAAQDVKASA